ncbi:MAG: hypothetical protein MJ198_08175 [Bacteroidales bacterium]|nr:hypothetical protein [Bacteroidales bacterium]
MRQKKTAIIILLPTILLLLLTSVLPHHHHLSEVCFTIQTCDIDGNLNDKHTDHHESNDESSEDNCVLKSQYSFFIDNENDSVLKNIQVESFLLATILSAEVELPLEFISHRKDCVLHSEKTPSKDKLRAPPSII